MIGSLRGKVEYKSTEYIVLDVGGVGYEVIVPLSVLASLPDVGEAAILAIHTHVREDELRLFGFNSRQDRLVFRTMLKISGVGPKVALAMLGALSGDQLAHIVEAGDAARLTAIPGIGKKTAERIVLELGGKLILGPMSEESPQGSTFGELTSALKNLGFKPAQVEKVLRGLESEGSADEKFEILLKKSLSILQGHR